MMDAEDLLLGGMDTHGAMQDLDLHANMPQDDPALHNLDLQLHEAHDFMLDYPVHNTQGGSAFDDLFVMPTGLAATQAGGTQAGKHSPAKGKINRALSTQRQYAANAAAAVVSLWR